MSNWTKYQMPEDMVGKTFLDVGCWEGLECAQAVLRGARAENVVGVDLVVDPKLRTLVEEHRFDFLQIDIFSDQFIALPVFDIVLCSGVLYHVQNPVSLLLRLRKVTGGMLVLETALTAIDSDELIMQFCPGASFRNNPSNWWLPNEACLMALLSECGFGKIEVVWRRTINDISRILLRAKPIALVNYGKMLARKPSRMGICGGTRPRV